MKEANILYAFADKGLGCCIKGSLSTYGYNFSKMKSNFFGYPVYILSVYIYIYIRWIAQVHPKCVESGGKDHECCVMFTFLLQFMKFENVNKLSGNYIFAKKSLREISQAPYRLFRPIYSSCVHSSQHSEIFHKIYVHPPPSGKWRFNIIPNRAAENARKIV